MLRKVFQLLKETLEYSDYECKELEYNITSCSDGDVVLEYIYRRDEYREYSEVRLIQCMNKGCTDIYELFSIRVLIKDHERTIQCYVLNEKVPLASSEDLLTILDHVMIVHSQSHLNTSRH
ncbi:MAG: hypothetical protein B6V02_00030 [Thermoprotei archaeon ex4572_64]|nr:MAG: hypothetical protein B6V02_00030 [Thermoprotei archaeon ex4572_64]